METYRAAMARAHRDYMHRVMEAADGKPTLAARLADVNRTHFYELLKRAVMHVRKANRGNWQSLEH